MTATAKRRRQQAKMGYRHLAAKDRPRYLKGQSAAQRARQEAERRLREARTAAQKRKRA